VTSPKKRAPVVKTAYQARRPRRYWRVLGREIAADIDRLRRGARRAGKSADARTLCRPNGPDAKLRGQGPRAEARAAHGVHACESRDAGRAPPPGLILTRRLGRRTEAGPRQLLRRVGRRGLGKGGILNWPASSFKNRSSLDASPSVS